MDEKREKKPDVFKDISNNKKARFEYEIIETFEAGLVLKGTEVKSLRTGKANINDAFAKISDGEAYIHQMHISVYEMGNRYNHDPDSVRKLLMKKKEIRRLFGTLTEKGLTLVPLKLYFKNGKVKILLGLGKGKTNYDKRESIQKKEAQREIQRAMKNRSR